MRKLEVKIRQIIWALNRLRTPSTYDLVIYKGNKYYVKSSLTGHNIWNLSIGGEIKYRLIKGEELRVVYSFKRAKRVFKEMMRFQETSWQSIDLSKPLGTRLSYYNSDNIRF